MFLFWQTLIFRQDLLWRLICLTQYRVKLLLERMRLINHDLYRLFVLFGYNDYIVAIHSLCLVLMEKPLNFQTVMFGISSFDH